MRSREQPNDVDHADVAGVDDVALPRVRSVGKSLPALGAGIPPTLQYELHAHADNDLPRRMGRAALRGNVPMHVAIAGLVAVMPMVLAIVFGETSLGLVFAAFVGLVLAPVPSVLAMFWAVPAVWRMRFRAKPWMSAVYKADRIRFGFGGWYFDVGLDQVRRCRDLGTALQVVPGRGRRLLIPAEVVPPPVADFLTGGTGHRRADSTEDHPDGLPDFIAAMTYWSALQLMLVDRGELHSKAPLFGVPYVQAERVMIPRGPGNAEDSDGYRDYWILRDGSGYSLRTRGRSRGDTYPERTAASFGHFDDAARYFVGTLVAGTTRNDCRSRHLDVVNVRWLSRGTAPGWAESRTAGARGFEASTYHRDDDTRFYSTGSDDSATSFLLNLSWRELTETFVAGIPGAEDVPMPLDW